MMKRMLLLTVVLLCAVAASSQETRAGAHAGAETQNGCTDAADVNAIRQIAAQWKDRYNSGDAPGVAALYAGNAYYLTQHYITGIIHGQASIQAYVQRGVDAHYHIDSIQIISMACSDDLAYTVGRYESTNSGQTAKGVNLVVVRKTSGHWLIVAHEAAVPDPATAVRHLDNNQSQ
jgi:ketosteroid isomerase-like protein